MEKSELEKKLRNDVSRLNRCLTELSKEDLNGKYKKSFRRLQEEIREEVNSIVYLMIPAPVRLGRKLTPQEMNSLQAVVNEYSRELHAAVYKERNTDEFYRILAMEQKAVFSFVTEHDGWIDDSMLSGHSSEKEVCCHGQNEIADCQYGAVR